MTDLDEFRGRRVLVTGGAGVIGREMLDLLVASGAEVLSADREPLPEPRDLRHLRMDLAIEDLAPLWEFRPEVVMHLAATFERAEESPDFWEPNWMDNVVLSHRLAEGAARAGVEALVFASSYLVYDPSRYLYPAPRAAAVALGEDERQDPRNLCGSAKLYAEKELRFVAEQLGGPSRLTLARIFRVYGRGSRDIVSRWVRAILDGEPLYVFQPENRFDYVFAGDVAEGLLRLAISEAQGVVNVGTGIDCSIADVIDNLRAALPERALSIEHEDRDAPYEASRADTSRLRDLVDWVPPTALADGMARVVAWEAALRARGSAGG